MSELDLQRIAFESERERELFARAQLSEQVRSFLESEVGRYLHGRAKMDLEQAQVDALQVDVSTWWGRRKFRKIQEKGRLAERFMAYLVEAINDGEHAFQELAGKEG